MKRMSFLTLLILAPALQAGTGVAGVLQDGKRMIRINPDRPPVQLTVYRGDYVVFLTRRDKPGLMKIDKLGLEIRLPMRAGDGHITLRDAGSFPFTINGKKGVLHVREYAKKGYFEVSAREADALIAKINPLILDVRTPAEYSQARLPGSLLIPVQELQSRLNELKPHAKRPFLIYCATGNRSTVASKILLDNGFPLLYNMRHGIREWHNEGLPLTR